MIGLTIIVYLLYLVSRIKCCSRKIKSLMTKIKGYLLWNPFIRYSFLNCLKFNMVAMTTFAGFAVTEMNVIVSVAIILFFTILAILYSIFMLKKNEDLSKLKNVKKYGSIYNGLRIPTKNKISLNGLGGYTTKKSENVIKISSLIYPIIFILRRFAFSVNTVVMFNYPHMQTIINLLISLGYTVFLLQRRLFDDKGLRNIEIFSECSYFLICTILLQY